MNNDITEYTESTLSTCSRLVGDELIMPDKLRNAINRLPEEYKSQSEDDLKHNYNYTMVDEKLRNSFWRMVNRLERYPAKGFKVNDLIRGICTEPYFYQKILRLPHKIAYIIQPAQQYELQTEALLSVGMSRLEEIITMDIAIPKKVFARYDDNGDPVFEYKKIVDPLRAKVLLDTVNKLEDRVKGTAVQRSVNVSTTAPTEDATLDMVAIEDEVNRLRKKMGIHTESIAVEYKEKV